MHNNRGGRQAGFFYVLPDFLDYIEVERLLTLELIGAVAGADRSCQRVALGLSDEFDCFLRICQTGMTFIDCDVFFNASQHPQLRLHTDAFGMSAIHDPLCDRDVLFERFMAGIYHDRTVKTGVDAIVTSLFIAVIKVDSEDRVRENLISLP